MILLTTEWARSYLPLDKSHRSDSGMILWTASRTISLFSVVTSQWWEHQMLFLMAETLGQEITCMWVSWNLLVLPALNTIVGPAQYLVLPIEFHGFALPMLPKMRHKCGPNKYCQFHFRDKYFWIASPYLVPKTFETTWKRSIKTLQRTRHCALDL